MTTTYDNETRTSPEVARTSPEISLLRQRLKSILVSETKYKKKLREEIIRLLNDSSNPNLFIAEVLTVCTSSSKTDRLNYAIDILSETGELIFNYSWDYLRTDLDQWNHLYSQRGYQPNDDYWYILLRAVARCDADEQKRLRFARACRGSDKRGVMEGVVEALGDIGTGEAKSTLQEISKNHTDSFVVELATDILSDEECWKN